MATATDTQKTVVELIAKHAQCDAGKVAPAVVLADLGINSLKFIMLLLEIEQATGKKVMDINKIGTLKTVGDVLALTA